VKRYFRRIYEYWLAFGQVIGLVMPPIQLGLVYGLVFGPGRLVAAALGKDLLDRRFLQRPTFWQQRQPEPATLESARHQF